jgi:hypothetical protein
MTQKIEEWCYHCVITFFFVCWNISFAIISVWNVNGIEQFLMFNQSSPSIENGYVKRKKINVSVPSNLVNVKFDVKTLQTLNK